MSDDDFGEFILAAIGFMTVLALIASIVLGFWAIVNPDQLLMMAERVLGIGCADLPGWLCGYAG